MSDIDIQSPETPSYMRPEDFHVRAPSGGSAPGLLTVIPVGVYIVAYTGQTQVRLGSSGPFMFNVFRADQQTVDLPTIAGCTIVKPDGSTVSADPINPSDPSDTALPIVAAAGEPGTMLPVYVLYALAEVGVYQIRLELAWGDVTASTPQQVTINCCL